MRKSIKRLVAQRANYRCEYCSSPALDPVTNEHIALFNPRLHDWSTHFVWVDRFSKIEGLSPLGRATVLKLQLNRVGLVNLRTLLHLYGKHP